LDAGQLNSKNFPINYISRASKNYYNGPNNIRALQTSPIIIKTKNTSHNCVAFFCRKNLITMSAVIQANMHAVKREKSQMCVALHIERL
jgi:hypothetical protein